MGKDEEELEPKDHAIKSLGFLWKAAREAGKAAKEAATGIRKEVKRGSLGKAIDDAGHEVARAAKNVGSRLGVIDPSKQKDPPRYPPGKKPKGPTDEDPGFSILTDDDDADDKKKKK